ncbi:MAG: class C sortase [Ruminococcus sp.]|nr:class C sortase [Ruminococcus sp.]
MKRRLLKCLLIFSFFLGIALLLYPSVSEYINARHQSAVVQNYQDAVNNLDDSDRKAIIEKAKEYNKRLAETPGAFYDPDLVSGYMETLDITGTGIMGYINIDKIDLELPVYHTVGADVLQVAIGHLPGSSLPVGGLGSHSVLSGHRGLPSARLFSDLDKMEPGDRFTITVLSEVYTYQVVDTKTVEPYEVDDLQLVPGKDLCTLFTCTPYGINTQRLFVRGKRIQNDKIEERRVYYTNEAYRVTPAIVAPALGVPVLIILYTVLVVRQWAGRLRRRKQAKKSQDE